MNLAKSLFVPEKNYYNHRAPMQWNGSFWPKINPNFAYRQGLLIRYSGIKEWSSFLLKGIELPTILSMCGLLLIVGWNFEYVNSLSLRDTHRFKKAKYWNIAHFCSEKENLIPAGTPRLTNQTLKRWRQLRMKA
jgi:hypothetical protein